MRIKKILALALATVMAIGCFAGCNKNKENEKGEKIMEIRDISAKELVSEMKIGWNLGNTLDASSAEGLAAETSWGNPKTREDMMKLLKDSGFNVLRLPVTWDDHMDENYNVDPEWMARVKEIVDYGINNDLFVILNTHHEEWYFPTKENKDEDIKQIKALWSQIAEEFKGYDEHLIFEGFNEPRLRGTSDEWTAGTPEAQAIVNDYAEAFYETVRNSGGNNGKRHLMLTGYGASSNASSMMALELPKDDDKIIVSVHAYLPYSFALDNNGTDQFDATKDAVIIDSLFMNLEYTFLAADVPVIIGEFGSLNKRNTEDRIECVQYFLKMAKEYGVPCIWWDNGAIFGTGENFGLMSRGEIPATWFFDEIVDAMMEAIK